MKILNLANNLPWKSWDKKTKELSDWFAPEIILDITTEQVHFTKIPFVDYQSTEREIYKGIEPAWYDKNISAPALARGFDCVIFNVGEDLWADKRVEGWSTHNNLGIHEIQILARENARYSFNNRRYPGDQWFNIARHELSHALYLHKGIPDNTHKHWEAGTLDEVKKELQGGFMSNSIILAFRRLLNPVRTLRYFNQSEIDGLDKEFVYLLDDIRHDAAIPFRLTSTLRKTGNHATGRAVDIRCTGGRLLAFVESLRLSFTPAQVYTIISIIINNEMFKDDNQAKIVASAIKHGVKRIGLYNRHAHLDTVPDKAEPTIWTGLSE
jgi:hypothetical protein